MQADTIITTIYSVYAKIKDWFVGAGLKQWAIILTVVLVLILLYGLLTWFIYKWQSDFVYKAAGLLVTFLVFVTVFCIIFWLHVNNWMPVRNLT